MIYPVFCSPFPIIHCFLSVVLFFFYSFFFWEPMEVTYIRHGFNLLQLFFLCYMGSDDQSLLFPSLCDVIANFFMLSVPSSFSPFDSHQIESILNAVWHCISILWFLSLPSAFMHKLFSDFLLVFFC